MADFQLRLSEAEAREALAEWARRHHGLSTRAEDVRFNITAGNPGDPRERPDTHVSGVTITAAGGPPRRTESAPRQWQGDTPIEPR